MAVIEETKSNKPTETIVLLKEAFTDHDKEKISVKSAEHGVNFNIYTQINC